VCGGVGMFVYGKYRVVPRYTRQMAADIAVKSRPRQGLASASALLFTFLLSVPGRGLYFGPKTIFIPLPF
jgi:hypothetical protein